MEAAVFPVDSIPRVPLNHSSSGLTCLLFSTTSVFSFIKGPREKEARSRWRTNATAARSICPKGIFLLIYQTQDPTGDGIDNRRRLSPIKGQKKARRTVCREYECESNVRASAYQVARVPWRCIASKQIYSFGHFLRFVLEPLLSNLKILNILCIRRTFFANK